MVERCIPLKVYQYVSCGNGDWLWASYQLSMIPNTHSPKEYMQDSNLIMFCCS